MIKHQWPQGIKGELNKENVKALFIDYLQTQISAHVDDLELTNLEKVVDLAKAVALSDFTADFVVQLLDHIHPVSIMERGLKA